MNDLYQTCSRVKAFSWIGYLKQDSFNRMKKIIVIGDSNQTSLLTVKLAFLLSCPVYSGEKEKANRGYCSSKVNFMITSITITITTSTISMSTALASSSSTTLLTYSSNNTSMTSSTSPKTFRYTFTFFQWVGKCTFGRCPKKVLANVTKIPWQMSQNMGWQMSGW